MEGLIPTFGDLIAISHDMPTTVLSEQDSGLSNTNSSLGPESSVLNYLARVMAIRPRGEQVEIACVVEHPLVHVADQ
jgi:hypothetical protein